MFPLTCSAIHPSVCFAVWVAGFWTRSPPLKYDETGRHPARCSKCPKNTSKKSWAAYSSIPQTFLWAVSRRKNDLCKARLITSCRQREKGSSAKLFVIRSVDCLTVFFGALSTTSPVTSRSNKNLGKAEISYTQQLTAKTIQTSQKLSRQEEKYEVLILMWTAPFSMWLNWLKPKGWRDLWHRVPASFTLDPLTPPLWSVPPSRPTVYLARTSRADNKELEGRQEDTPPASRHPRWCLHVNVI